MYPNIDKQTAYSILSNMNLPDRTIKFYIKKTYNPPNIPWNVVTSDSYHIENQLITSYAHSPHEVYFDTVRFEYDLKEEFVYIYHTTNIDHDEKLWYVLSKQFIENHYEPVNQHIKIDVDLTLPGQQKCTLDANDIERFKIYIKNTGLTMIELNDKYTCGYNFYGGHDYSNDVHLNEWSMQAKLRLETMCYDASKDFYSMVTFKYFKDTNIAYFKFWDQTDDRTTGTLKYEIAITKDQLESLGVRIVSNI